MKSLCYCSVCDDKVKPSEKLAWLKDAEEHVTVYYCSKCGKYFGVCI